MHDPLFQREVNFYKNIVPTLSDDMKKYIFVPKIGTNSNYLLFEHNENYEQDDRMLLLDKQKDQVMDLME